MVKIKCADREVEGLATCSRSSVGVGADVRVCLCVRAYACVRVRACVCVRACVSACACVAGRLGARRDARHRRGRPLLRLARVAWRLLFSRPFFSRPYFLRPVFSPHSRPSVARTANDGRGLRGLAQVPRRLQLPAARHATHTKKRTRSR